MDEQCVKDLLAKYKAGTISDAEMAVLNKWYLHVAVDSSAELSEAERLHTFDEVLLHLEHISAPAKSRPFWLYLMDTRYCKHAIRAKKRNVKIKMGWRFGVRNGVFIRTEKDSNKIRNPLNH